MPKRSASNKSPSRKSWGVAVRLADGHLSYLYLDPSLNGPRGRPLERWTQRISQAHQFSSEQEARQVAESMKTNAAAKEYQTVDLPLR